MTTDPAGAPPPAASPDRPLVEIATVTEYSQIEAVSRAADRHEVFSPLTAELLRWFLDDNPCGPGFVVVARDRGGGRIIGHFVFYRWTLRRRAAGATVDVPAALYVRLYVDPTARRRGVFAAMTRAGLEHLASLDVPLAYTAPNPRSSPGFVKFGMQRIGPHPFRLRPALPGWGWLTGPPTRGITVERRERFDRTFDNVTDAGLPESVKLWSPRRAALLNWRYVMRPDARYEIRYLVDRSGPTGFLVTRRMAITGRDVMALCDFWVKPGQEAALRVGVDDALTANRGVRAAIAIGASAVPHLGRALTRAAFVSLPTAILPQPVLLFGGAVERAGAPMRLPARDAWFVTPYDWDVF
jgi:GNAT superfamily N-acetyltransferase